MISANVVVIGVLLLVAAYVLLWCFVRPVKFLVKAAAKGAVGCIVLALCNHFLAGVGFCVGINAVTAAICGLLGLNGLLLLTAVNYFIH
jgi:pro-sigmaK processing inhibitor BofA